MTSKAPEASDAEPKTEEMKNLLAQTRELAKRVERMQDGPRKDRLRSALAELQAVADQLKPAAPGGG